MQHDKHDTPMAFDVASAARYLGIGITKLRELASDGTIPTKRIGRRLLFNREHLDAYRLNVGASTSEPQPPTARTLSGGKLQPRAAMAGSRIRPIEL